ncbi:Protein phosphatase 2C family protein [Dioscorea alata]|uniref:Protein phosphatase 2C family protein n=2 Tax=Dioscorea alata TaxID=55571 RepID=A0ACB7V894_DIOAL|nr:Protein phosphatase 2C family protein [Dioscorea alata]KAH7669794.1 Protein phosphatase 2C family protein [Dioscorea alata]
MEYIQAKFVALKLRVQKIKVAKVLNRLTTAFEEWMMEKYQIGHAIPSNDEQYIGSVLMWKKNVETSLVMLHGVFDSNAGREIETYLNSQLADKRFTAKEFWRNSERILKNVMISSSRRKMDKDNVEGGDDNGGFALMLNVRNKKFIAADRGNYKAVLVSKGGNASQITGNNRPTVSDLLHFKFQSPRERNLGMIIKKVKPANGESVILASDGIWQVMGIQEAGHLILSREDAQEAAQVLVNEALRRNCKSIPSCIVIRFL